MCFKLFYVLCNNSFPISIIRPYINVLNVLYINWSYKKRTPTRPQIPKQNVKYLGTVRCGRAIYVSERNQFLLCIFISLISQVSLLKNYCACAVVFFVTIVYYMLKIKVIYLFMIANKDTQNHRRI